MSVLPSEGSMRQVTSILTPEQFAWFEAERTRRKITRSELIRVLVETARFCDDATKLSMPELLAKYRVVSK